MPRNGVWLFNHPRDVADTVEACALLQTEGDRAKACMRAIDYCHGFSKPHFKVPAMTNRAIAKSIFNQDKAGNLKAYRERLNP